MLSLKVNETCKKKIVSELGKTLKDLEEQTKIVKEWIKTQTHLPEIPSTNMIEFVVVNSKFKIEKIKQKVELYYTIKNSYPDFYDNVNPKLQTVKEGMNNQLIVPIPKLIEDKYRLIVFKMKDNEEGFNDDAQLALVVNLYEIRMQEDFSLSDIILFDFEHVTMTHVYKTSFAMVRRAAYILEKLYSNRIKAVHIINYHPICRLLYKMASMVLKQKLLDRVKFHNSVESLCQHIPKESLPSDYGGDQKSLDEIEELWKTKLVEYADRFDELDTLRVNDALRPAPMKDNETLNLQGTFRKLIVD
ncbi:unnamed protein product [Phyllotreta striolata]|uniref:CRAL-TRIO domain-containing protein n=1 Tax=Phyllotreta striolata TaxID=444603 RepID=A0A9N9XJY1_PHYSR|nr:unnamed protein product [Phyllotreta striolata]